MNRDFSDEQYRMHAKEQYERNDDIEFDTNASVSRECGGGAFVQAWVWVDDEDL